MLSNVKPKTNSSFPVKVTEEAAIYFYCVFDESRFSDNLYDNGSTKREVKVLN